MPIKVYLFPGKKAKRLNPGHIALEIIPSDEDILEYNQKLKKDRLKNVATAAHRLSIDHNANLHFDNKEKIKTIYRSFGSNLGTLEEDTKEYGDPDEIQILHTDQSFAKLAQLIDELETSYGKYSRLSNNCADFVSDFFTKKLNITLHPKKSLKHLGVTAPTSVAKAIKHWNNLSNRDHAAHQAQPLAKNESDDASDRLSESEDDPDKLSWHQMMLTSYENSWSKDDGDTPDNHRVSTSSSAPWLTRRRQA